MALVSAVDGAILDSDDGGRDVGEPLDPQATKSAPASPMRTSRQDIARMLVTVRGSAGSGER